MKERPLQSAETYAAYCKKAIKAYRRQDLDRLLEIRFEVAQAGAIWTDVLLTLIDDCLKTFTKD